jgi:hypothetical protein
VKEGGTAVEAESKGKRLSVPREADEQAGQSMRGFRGWIFTEEVSSESRVNSDRQRGGTKGRPLKSRDGEKEFRQVRIVIRFLVLLIVANLATAGAEPADSPAASAGSAKVLHAVVSAKKEFKGRKKFLSGTPKIYGLWKGEALQAGDIVRAVWIAESFGYTRKDVKITEGETTAYKPDDDGIFSLVRPEGGWPIGRYRLEFYVRDRLAETVRFSIEEDVTVEVR